MPDLSAIALSCHIDTTELAAVETRVAALTGAVTDLIAALRVVETRLGSIPIPAGERAGWEAAGRDRAAGPIATKGA